MRIARSRRVSLTLPAPAAGELAFYVATSEIRLASAGKRFRTFTLPIAIRG